MKPRVQDCVFMKILQILLEPQKKMHKGFQAPQLYNKLDDGFK